MKLPLTTAVLASLASLALALPTPDSDAFAIPVGEAPRAAQVTTHLYVCTDIDFAGTCQNLASVEGTCYNLGNGIDDTISSLGPDKGTTCTVYNDINCSNADGSLGGIVNPGIQDLRDYNFNDIISSYRCVAS